jgi:hypothetical protein
MRTLATRLSALVVVTLVAALVGFGAAGPATAEQLPPNNVDWLLTADEAATAIGTTTPLKVSKVRLTQVMWSQSFVAPGSAEPRAGVTLLHYTNPKPLTQAVLGKLSAGSVFGADVAKGYQCTLTKENAIPGRLRATRVCWNDGLVIAASTIKIGSWVLGGWTTLRPTAGSVVTAEMRDQAAQEARSLRAAQSKKLIASVH